MLNRQVVSTEQVIPSAVPQERYLDIQAPSALHQVPKSSWKKNLLICFLFWFDLKAKFCFWLYQDNILLSSQGWSQPCGNYSECWNYPCLLKASVSWVYIVMTLIMLFVWACALVTFFSVTEQFKGGTICFRAHFQRDFKAPREGRLAAWLCSWFSIPVGLARSGNRAEWLESQQV